MTDLGLAMDSSDKWTCPILSVSWTPLCFMMMRWWLDDEDYLIIPLTDTSVFHLISLVNISTNSNSVSVLIFVHKTKRILDSCSLHWENWPALFVWIETRPIWKLSVCPCNNDRIILHITLIRKCLLKEDYLNICQGRDTISHPISSPAFLVANATLY